MRDLVKKAAAGTGNQLPATLATPELAGDWKAQYIESLTLATQAESSLPLSERERVSQARQGFPAIVRGGYAGLIDWQNPDNRLRRLLLPSKEEQNAAGTLDTSEEGLSAVVRGFSKDEQTAVLLLTQGCAGHYRCCFRRRLMSRDAITKETIEDRQQCDRLHLGAPRNRQRAAIWRRSNGIKHPSARQSVCRIKTHPSHLASPHQHQTSRIFAGTLHHRSRNSHSFTALPFALPKLFSVPLRLSPRTHPRN